MGKKDFYSKDETRKNIISLVTGAVLLVGLYLLCNATGILNNFYDMYSQLNINVDTIIKVGLVAAIVYVFSKFITLVLRLVHFFGETGTKIVISLMNYICPVIGIGWALSIIGVEIQTIVASVGILALAVSFGAETLIEDCITGLFMIGEHQFKIGDYILVDGFRGQVVDIGIRTTTVKDENKNVRFFNNSSLKNVINLSKEKSVGVVDVTVPKEFDINEFINKYNALKSNNSNDDTFNWANVEYLGISELTENSYRVKFTVLEDESVVNQVKRELLKRLMELL